jgi:hypothetical protein
MIEGNKTEGFTLSCDHCGDTCDELFDSFQEAVDYKTNRENRWASVKDKNGDWQELCPSCNTPEIIAEIKGIAVPGKPRDDLSGTALALKALEEDC